MGTDTGNAQEGDELSPLSLQITSSALAAKEDSSRARGAAPRAVSGDATLTFTSGAVSLEFIELQLAPSVTCEGLAPEARAALDAEGWRCAGGKVQAAGPFRVDLLSGEGAPALPALPAGDYKLVDLRLAPADGVTLSATGELARPGAAPASFALSLRFTEDARFKKPDGALLRLEAGAPLALFLDVATWFEGVDVGACAAAGELEEEALGVIALGRGRGRCQRLTEVVRHNIKESGRTRP